MAASTLALLEGLGKKLSPTVTGLFLFHDLAFIDPVDFHTGKLHIFERIYTV